jgi:hypothetical protein
MGTGPTGLGENDSIEVVLRHFHQHCYKSSPLWFIVGGTKALVRSN